MIRLKMKHYQKNDMTHSRPMKRLAAGAGLAAAVLLPGTGGAGSAAPLPSGATSLNETYQGWQVSCTAKDGVNRCAMFQIQADPKTRKRVLTFQIEFREEGPRGTMTVPFGLALEKGVALKVDEGEAWAPLSFATCLPAGCLVTSPLSAQQIEALQKGTSLTVGAAAHGSGQRLDFTVPLSGFSAAFARLQHLSRGE